MDDIKKIKFVEFTGEETEKQFLKKCYRQWVIAGNADVSDTQKMLIVGSVFREMDHRIREL